MQLSDAIRAWLSAHESGLSRSTSDDIEQIAVAADARGYGGVQCDELSESGRDETVEEAEANSTLAPAAIREFLKIVTAWAAEQDEDDADSGSDSLLLVPDADAQSDAGSGTVDSADDSSSTDSDAISETEQPDLTRSDESELDELLSSDDQTGELSIVDGPQDSEPQAASLLQTLDQSAPVAAPSVFGDLTKGDDMPVAAPVAGVVDPSVAGTEGASSGIFSEAAQDTDQSVDWITVAYFVAAAICFAFVIYLYFTN